MTTTQPIAEIYIVSGGNLVNMVYSGIIFLYALRTLFRLSDAPKWDCPIINVKTAWVFLLLGIGAGFTFALYNLLLITETLSTWKLIPNHALLNLISLSKLITMHIGVFVISKHVVYLYDNGTLCFCGCGKNENI